MGVRGLQTFLKKNEHLLADRTDVSDCSLVIDANNLLIRLYVGSALDRDGPDYRSDIYGGDLVSYGQLIREFFKNLEKCKITAVLVFDGSAVGKHALKNFIGSKERELYKRGLERFNRARLMSEFPVDDEIIMPQSMNVLFRNIATEFGIQRKQAPYEADQHIARIANELNCPVLTNDSDFFIYSLKRGFILLDSFDYKKPIVDSSGKSRIKCSIYSHEKLMRTMGSFNAENMPLLSILLGNDYVEADTFDRLLKSICNGHYGGQFVTMSFNHRRIANLLAWVRGKSLSESIDFVLKQVASANRDELEKIIRLLMESYRIETIDDFDVELGQIYPPNEAHSGASETPVQYLRKRMERHDLGAMALGMIFRETHYDHTVIDDLSLPSSSCVKYRPYSLALTLLRPNSSMKDIFDVYDRIKDYFGKHEVKPMETLENFGSLENITCYSMIALEPSAKMTILMDCFRFNSKEEDSITKIVSRVLAGSFVSEASLCFLLVKYIGLETKLAPTRQFVAALMLTLFYYAASSGNLNKQSLPDEDAYGRLLLCLSPHATTNNKITYDNKDRSLFRKIAHFVNQLLAAYKAYCLVNSLLDHVYHPPKQEQFFNGVLIYRLTKLLRLEEVTIEGLCNNLPVLEEVCESLTAQVVCS